MFLSRLILLTLLLVISASASAQMACQSLFAAYTPERQAIKDLADLRLKIDLAQARGLNTPQMTSLKKAYIQKEKSLETYLENEKIMTPVELRAAIGREIVLIQSTRAENLVTETKVREEQKTEAINTVIDGSRMIFHEIQPGKFEMYDKVARKKWVPTELTQPYEMAATVTTQIVWKKIVEAAQARFPGKYDALMADPSTFKGDLRPVETVAPPTIYLWFKALNELAQAGDPVVKAMMRDHQTGDVYKLPTEAQWIFVASVRGTVKDEFHFGKKDSPSLSDHAWVDEPIDSGTHPVALKKPLIIGKSEFYDIHGNVAELMRDASDGTLPGGKDPFVWVENPKFISVRSGSYYHRYYISSNLHRVGQRIDIADQGVGFRIVREHE
jgi:formylglycine-generating enzyme required for sulfatase activity